MPKTWTQTATNVVVQKYFRGMVGTPERERSVRQLHLPRGRHHHRLGEARPGRQERSYFADDESAEIFNAELKHLLVEQKMSFNSPVWFNVGIEAEPQCSACFINSVDDTMESILGLAKTEGMLFKYGSGTGTNLSPIRSSKELLNGGGTASGPVSFMRGFDAFAGVIKSGGKTRRAAKMVILNIDHPDVDEFIWCKAKEEKKAWTLIDAGYDGSFDGEAYKSVFFQNSNNSVRVTDDFMEAVQKDRDWSTPRRARRQPGRDLQGARAVARDRRGGLAVRRPRPAVRHHHQRLAHLGGDGAHQRLEPLLRVHVPRRLGLQPGVAEPAQVRPTRRPNAGEFDVESFRRAVEIDHPRRRRSSSATPSTRRERIARELARASGRSGLGYANLGALLMSRGLPYDSAPARAYAGAITALMTGWAYRTSAVIARDVTGPFDGYAENQRAVPRRHEEAPPPRRQDRRRRTCPADLMDGRARRLGQTLAIGKRARLPQRPGHGAGADRDHRLHDGLRHHRHRAGHRAHQVQAAGRRRHDQDRQQHDARGAGPARLRRGRRCKAIVDYIDTEETIEGAPGLKPTSTCRCSTAPSARPTARGRSTTWATSG